MRYLALTMQVRLYRAVHRDGATVFRIVTQSGGQVSVASEPGHGTSFRMQLPLSGIDVR